MHLKFCLALLVLMAPLVAYAEGSIKIGSIAAYTGHPLSTQPYKKGLDLAIKEANTQGGVKGQQVEVLHRDNEGRPDQAIRVAQELAHNESVLFLTGGFLSHVGLAISNVAKRNQIGFIAAPGTATDALLWEKGHPYVFRVRPGVYSQVAGLVDVVAKWPEKRWAIIAPNYEYGHAVASRFKALLSQKRPDITWVAERWPTLKKINAGAEVGALKRAQPEAVLSVLFGSDLAAYIRESYKRGLGQTIKHASLEAGLPENMEPLGSQAPEGWVVQGYPYDDFITQAHADFVKGYREVYKENPTYGSLRGYMAGQVIIDALKHAQSLDRKSVLESMRTLKTQTIFGPAHIRHMDGQLTNYFWIGTVKIIDGKPQLKEHKLLNASDYMPTDAWIKQQWKEK